MNTEQNISKRTYNSSKEIYANVDRLLILEVVRLKLGLSRASMGKRSGFYPQQVRVWYMHDDIQLSYLFKIMEDLNIKAVPSFVRDTAAEVREEEFENSSSKIHFKVETTPQKSLSIDDIKNKYPEEFVERYLEGGRTKPVVDLILNQGDAFSTACRKTGTVNPTNLKFWLKNDDMKLSRLYSFANAYGMKIHWELSYND